MELPFTLLQAEPGLMVLSLYKGVCRSDGSLPPPPPPFPLPFPFPQSV